MSAHDTNADRTAYTTLGLLFGIAAGIGLGMLVAPRSGVETRSKLGGRAKDVKQQAQDQLIAARDAATSKVADTLDKSKGVVNQVADKAKTKVDKTANRAKDAADRAKSESDDNTPQQY